MEEGNFQCLNSTGRAESKVKREKYFSSKQERLSNDFNFPTRKNTM